MSIKFDRNAKACSICGTAFKDGQEFVTALRQTEEDEVFFRADICNLCWPKQEAESFYCHWNGEFSANFKPLLLDADTLWQIFARSHVKAFEDPEMAEFACVSALALMRLKQLVLEDNGLNDGQPTMQFRTRGKVRATYEVPDCNLDESALNRVQEALEGFLEAGAEDQESETDQPTQDQD